MEGSEEVVETETVGDLGQLDQLLHGVLRHGILHAPVTLPRCALRHCFVQILLYKLLRILIITQLQQPLHTINHINPNIRRILTLQLIRKLINKPNYLLQINLFGFEIDLESLTEESVLDVIVDCDDGFEDLGTHLFEE